MVDNIYWSTAPAKAGTIQNPTMWMAGWSDYAKNTNTRTVSYFLDETYWTAFKNESASYSTYVEGAIGTPTLEMFVASWNAKRAATNDTTSYNKKLKLVEDETKGYFINNITTSDPATKNAYVQSLSKEDNLYIWNTAENSSVWLATPCGCNYFDIFYLYNSGYIDYNNYGGSKYFGVRPVVCLNANVPATNGTATDYSLIK